MYHDKFLRSRTWEVGTVLICMSCMPTLLSFQYNHFKRYTLFLFPVQHQMTMECPMKQIYSPGGEDCTRRFILSVILYKLKMRMLSQFSIGLSQDENNDK